MLAVKIVGQSSAVSSHMTTGVKPCPIFLRLRIHSRRSQAQLRLQFFSTRALVFETGTFGRVLGDLDAACCEIPPRLQRIDRCHTSQCCQNLGCRQAKPIFKMLCQRPPCCHRPECCSSPDGTCSSGNSCCSNIDQHVLCLVRVALITLLL